MANIRLIKHEAVPKCAGFEVRFPDRADALYVVTEPLVNTNRIQINKLAMGRFTARRPTSKRVVSCLMEQTSRI
jgi:hypothetical protein